MCSIFLSKCVMQTQEKIFNAFSLNVLASSIWKIDGCGPSPTIRFKECGHKSYQINGNKGLYNIQENISCIPWTPRIGPGVNNKLLVIINIRNEKNE